MNKFRQKRSSLENFIKEQIIGPGAYNRRYFLLEDLKLGTHEFSQKVIDEENALANFSEVIPEVPAYQYSSGILFPETRFHATESRSEEADEFDHLDTDTENLGEDGNTSADDEDTNDSSEENVVNKQQNYPNQMGLSFVVEEDTNFSSDFQARLKFRIYRRVSKTTSFRKELGIWIPEYKEEIRKAIETHFNPILGVEVIDTNYFVLLKQEITKDNIYSLDYVNLNQFIHSRIINLVETVIPDIQLLKDKNDTKYFGLKGETYELQLYSKGSKFYGNTTYENVITLFDNSITDFLQAQLKEAAQDFTHYKELIISLEIFNQLKNIINDLKSVHKERNATPIWLSRPYEINISLPEPDRTKVIDRKEEFSVSPGNPEISGLRAKVQYINRSGLIYIKLLLINRNSISLDPAKPTQLNKKDEANNLSFFGVELKITEEKANVMKPYNPPQLLDIDEEDNFNKLLYRKFLDYGEGYNTSVTWGKDEKFNFISTDFLPEQETPKVDFMPSKIEDGEITSRLQNDEVLSMRFLSTLSSTKDSDIIKALDTFIEDYKIWILEKEDILNRDRALIPSQREVLQKQLAACSRDFQRLKRNINLLKNSSPGMAAFRLMNTSMFMQLHHGILNKEAVITKSLDEDYYRNVELTKDYKWRSFQIAFILLNLDAFIRPPDNDDTVKDVFGTGWPERNEIADLVWFPTGGGKTEAYLGIIAFTIAYRRFTKKDKGYGTTVLMRYTLRLLTLQQFQRATLLICALEVIRKDHFYIPNNFSLGEERITIGLFVGGGSLPNNWDESGNDEENSMFGELVKIIRSIQNNRKIRTNLPFDNCPWCAEKLFISEDLNNVLPKPTPGGTPDQPTYGTRQANELSITCNNISCSFHGEFPTPEESIPFRLFDEDIFKHPPTLLFGTVDKFAALANKVSTANNGTNSDSRRLLGKGRNRDLLPPELIIQDELHLLLGPLGTAVGLYEKGLDKLCTYNNGRNEELRPKIITSTATTRNTDKQIFALFNRRSEIFPKQGITADDSFFAYYERKKEEEYISNRKYIGILPVGKTQVWMQLRIASVTLAHRLKYLKENFTYEQLFLTEEFSSEMEKVFDYYHTVLLYFNSLKDVGKTQSQLSHYLPGDLNYIIKNTIPWSFLDKILRKEGQIYYSELTGRLTGEEVKTNLHEIETSWSFLTGKDGNAVLNSKNPPEIVIATNMISVGIDVSRFNSMIISSMPRNVAEYIQASSRVARDREGIVFTIHHPFRSRDISHYQKFREFHEKFYSYVEPISVTPFANKALDRYLAMLAAVLIRHNESFQLMDNGDASHNVQDLRESIKDLIMGEIKMIWENSNKLERHLNERKYGVKSSVQGIISKEEVKETEKKLLHLLDKWERRQNETLRTEPPTELNYRTHNNPSNSLFLSVLSENYPNHWKVSHSLREIPPSTVIKTVQQ